jgi:metal-responsive CopG/Arc/MetJ family transcriptional regulator
MSTIKTGITLDKQLLSRIDTVRGPVNRSAYIAGVLHRHLKSEDELKI